MKLRQIIIGLCCAVLVSISAIRLGLAASIYEYTFQLEQFGIRTHHYIVTKELQQLSNHDVVLIIDKSRSMLIKDCFPALIDNNSACQIYKPVSRWQWCHEQTFQLAKKSKIALPRGLTIVLFAKKFVTYNNADIGSIEAIFAANEPDGGTDTATALSSQIDAYFTRKINLGERTRPLLIAIISDGCPDNAASFCDVIVKASQNMKQPSEISITFLQVGNDNRAIYLLKQLKNGLLDQNAKFNIVNIIPFPELNKIGLQQAIFDVTSMHSSARDSIFVGKDKQVLVRQVNLTINQPSQGTK